MNRKGDVPTILLFVISFGLILMALFLFFSFKDDFSQKSVTISNVLRKIDFYEKFVNEENAIYFRRTLENMGLFSENFVGPVFIDENTFKKEFVRVVESGVRLNGLENYYGKIRRGEFNFVFNEKGYFFDMPYLYLKLSNNGEKYKRKINLWVGFDKKGNEISVEKDIFVK